MAQVDFSNAVLDVYAGKPLSMRSDYLGINAYRRLFDDNSSYSQESCVSENETLTKITDTPQKASFLYTGTFSKSGNHFYLASQYNSGSELIFAWKVSNISFSSGDTYSFVIDIETSGNT